MFQIDPTYEPPESETRTLFGLQLTQRRNDAVINKLLFKNGVTSNTDVSCLKGVIQVMPCLAACLCLIPYKPLTVEALYFTGLLVSMRRL